MNRQGRIIVEFERFGIGMGMKLRRVIVRLKKRDIEDGVETREV